MEKPLVSVLTTAFNRESYIAQAIESVMNQTYSNWELIVLDDCSTDSTVKIAKTFAENDKRINVYINEINLGDYPNRNRAVSLSKGSLIVFVDSDDMIKPSAISHIVNLFLKFPDSSFMTLNRDKFYKNEIMVSSNDFVRRSFYNHSNLHFGPGATVIKKTFFDEIGGFPTKYGPANDMFYNIKAASNSPIILCKMEYLDYRIHEGQEINNIYSYLYNGYLYFEDVMRLSELPLSSEERKYFIKKNKRRFIVNSINYFLKTKNLRNTFNAYRKVQFRLKDLIIGIFQFNF